jgi:hypothetical protein
MTEKEKLIRHLAEEVMQNHDDAAVIAAMRGEVSLMIYRRDAACQCGRGSFDYLWCGVEWRCELCFEVVPGPRTESP